MKTTIAAAMSSLLALAPPAFAQDSVPVSFPSGASGTTINGTIVGDEYIDYVLNARAGQTMTASLRVTGTNGNGSAMFNILPAGQDYPALYNGQMDDDNRAEVLLADSGDWTIRVYLMGSDRDTGKTVGFSIDVGIGGAGGSGGGGPTTMVTGLTAGDLLNVRSGPGTGNAIIGKLGNGDRVQRLGCRMNGSTEWCEIEMMTDMRERGWVAAQYLSGGEDTATTDDGGGAMAGAGGTSDERVRFPAGSTGTELTSQLMPGASKRYILGASNGQNLYFRLAANGPGMSYQIFNPDGSFLLDMMGAETEYRGQLWQSGDHVIEVINRSNGVQSYNVIFGID